MCSVAIHRPSDHILFLPYPLLIILRRLTLLTKVPWSSHLSLPYPLLIILRRLTLMRLSGAIPTTELVLTTHRCGPSRRLTRPRRQVAPLQSRLLPRLASWRPRRRQR